MTKTTLDNALIDGLDVEQKPVDFECIKCGLANIIERKHAAVAEITTHAKVKGEIMHFDLFGPVNGFYELIIYDDKTEFAWKYTMDSKTQAANYIIELFTWFEKHHGPILSYRCDNALDFLNEKTSTFFKLRNIDPLPIASYDPKSNGRVEKRMQELMSNTRPILMASAAGVGNERLRYAMQQAVNLMNIQPCTRDPTTTPYEQLNNKKPSTNLLHKFDQMVIIKNFNKKLKYEMNGKLGRWMGVAGNSEHTHIVEVEVNQKNYGKDKNIIISRKRFIKVSTIKFCKENEDQENKDVDTTPFEADEVQIIGDDGAELFEGENDDICRMCKKHGKLLMCDGCPASFHLKCIGSARTPPVGVWKCRDCIHKEIENKEKVQEGEVKLDSYEARQQVPLPEALLERNVELRKEIAAAIEKVVDALQPDEATTAPTNKTHQAETRASDKNENAPKSMRHRRNIARKKKKEKINLIKLNKLNIINKLRYDKNIVSGIHPDLAHLDSKKLKEIFFYFLKVENPDHNVFLSKFKLSRMSGLPAPTNSAEAFGGAETDMWLAAANEEFQYMVKNGNLILEKDTGQRREPTVWVFTKKEKEEMLAYRARLAYCGNFENKNNILPERTSSQVATSESKRILLAENAGKQGMQFRTFDIEKAHLQADLPDGKPATYIRTPAGITIPDGMVIRVARSIYGMIEAAYNFTEKFSADLATEGWVRLVYDSGVYMKVVGNEKSSLIVHVDDGLMMSKDADGEIDIINKHYRLTRGG